MAGLQPAPVAWRKSASSRSPPGSGTVRMRSGCASGGAEIRRTPGVDSTSGRGQRSGMVKGGSRLRPYRAGDRQTVRSVPGRRESDGRQGIVAHLLNPSRAGLLALAEVVTRSLSPQPRFVAESPWYVCRPLGHQGRSPWRAGLTSGPPKLRFGGHTICDGSGLNEEDRSG